MKQSSSAFTPQIESWSEEETKSNIKQPYNFKQKHILLYTTTKLPIVHASSCLLFLPLWFRAEKKCGLVIQDDMKFFFCRASDFYSHLPDEQGTSQIVNHKKFSTLTVYNCPRPHIKKYMYQHYWSIKWTVHSCK